MAASAPEAAQVAGSHAITDGDYVNQGQVLGFSGDIGFSTGPHVHFEVAVNGIPIDPLRVLPSR